MTELVTPQAVSNPAAAGSGRGPLLQVEGLTKHFPVRGGGVFERTQFVQAVDGVDLALGAGETIGLVGESGCGKTTTGRMLVKLIEPTAGKIVFEGKDITHASRGEMRAMRRDIQIIFQDPYSSLNPRHTVGDIVAMPMEVGGIDPPGGVRKRVRELLELVGLNPEHYNRYPHEFSGGQRQRIGIARALAAEPDLIVCDEAVSALDVSVKAQIVNLLQDLQQELGLALLFISHDLAIVEHMTRRVAVMYLGKIVEVAPKRQIFAAPRHPYTLALLSAVPVPEPGAARKRIILSGDVPSPINPPKGCRFHTRCPYAFDRCRVQEPELRPTEDGHFAACHLNELPSVENPMMSNLASNGGRMQIRKNSLT
jgi:peptide/nickel transport system ATP-binding protein